MISLALLVATFATAATKSERLPVAAKWEPYELTFRSKVKYENAVQDATLDVEFISPTGQTNRVPGFWDGGKIWRVRFAPDLPGRWAYHTICSDSDNKGLHRQSGEFLCVAATGKTRFGEHGPLRVARGGRHLEHADRTPFLWLADAAWDAPRRAELGHFQFYARVRASQKFNVAQWTLSPGTDAKGELPFDGSERITINPEFFKRLDAKVTALNREGLLNAIAPLWEVGADKFLPEDQARILLRYAVARWGANDVAWILAFEGGNSGEAVQRWKKLGREIFGERPDALVILFPGETYWVMDEFRKEDWVDAFGCQIPSVVDDNSLQWLLTGPLTLERRKLPIRPMITLLPPAENASANASGESVDAEKMRRLMWWNVLLNTPAGISYSAPAVATWDTSAEIRPEGEKPDLPAWQKSLFLAGAQDVMPFIDFFNRIEFWRLRPYPRAIASQPGNESPRRHVVAAGTEAQDLLVAYVPEDRSVNVFLAAIPQSPGVMWINPRNGKRIGAPAVIGETDCQFGTPDEGDWLLVVRSVK